MIEKSGQHGKQLSHKVIKEIIRESTKKRFMLSDDSNYIRAGYGHTIDVDLKMTPGEPPKELYHGTAESNVSSILKDGIHSGNRNFVHLSATKAEAKSVGGRHGNR